MYSEVEGIGGMSPLFLFLRRLPLPILLSTALNKIYTNYNEIVILAINVMSISHSSLFDIK
jgi:hypothetical protein